MRLRIHQEQPGQDSSRQDTPNAIPEEMPTELPLGLQTKHSNPEQHSPAVRLRGSPGHNSERYSVGLWRKHTSVGRYHATFTAQFQTLRAQNEKNYNTIIGARHPITPGIIRHAAYLLTRYAVHSDNMTSYYGRWHKEHKTPLCELGETVQYMIQDVRRQGKLEHGFFTGIWLGKEMHKQMNPYSAHPARSSKH